MTTKLRRQQIFEMVATPTENAQTLAALRRGLAEKKDEILTVRNEYGHSLLRSAVEVHMDSKKGGNWDIIRLLLELGADANLRWMDPVRVDYCNAMSDRKIVYEGEILIDYVISRAHNTPGAFELLRLLVDVGKADCTCLRHDGKSILKTAVIGNNWDIAKWLLFEVSSVDLESFSIVCARGQWNLARLFVEKGMDVKARCASSGYQSLTALHCACLGKRNVSGEDNEHQRKVTNPIEMMGQVEVVKGLLDCPGTDPDAVDSKGRTCLHLIAAEVAEYVEEDSKEDSAGTDQFDAVGKGKFLMMAMLMKAGANPNAQDDDGVTPLHEFARKGDEAAVLQLLAAGADSSVEDNKHLTACDVAHLKVYKAMGLQTAGETFVEALFLPMSVVVSPFRFGVNWALNSREEAEAVEEKQLKLLISPLRKAAGVVSSSPVPSRQERDKNKTAALSPATTRSSLISAIDAETPMTGHHSGGTDRHSVQNDSDAGETARSTITGTDLGVPSEVCGERSERDECGPSTMPQQRHHQQQPQQQQVTTKTGLSPDSLVHSSSHSNISDLNHDSNHCHTSLPHTSTSDLIPPIPPAATPATATIHIETDKAEVGEEGLKFSSNPLAVNLDITNFSTISNAGDAKVVAATPSPPLPVNHLPLEEEHHEKVVTVEKTKTVVAESATTMSAPAPIVSEAKVIVPPPTKPSSSSSSSSSSNKKKKRK